MPATLLVEVLLAINLLIMAGISSIWYKIGKMEARLHAHIDNHNHEEDPPDGRTRHPQR